jgi:hypothetical protein
VKKHLVTVHTLAVLPLQDVEREWLNYRKRGIGPENVAELIRFATDPAQLEEEWGGEIMAASSHAMRALAQMKAKDALAPLLDFVGRCYDESCDDVADEMRIVLGRFGPMALPELEVYLADPSKLSGPRGVVADALTELAVDDPSQRAGCVAILGRQLQQTFEKERDRELTSILVDCLIFLEAGEAAPLVQRVYEAGMVDEESSGTWEDAQVALGLKEADEEYDEYEDSDDGEYWQRPSTPGWAEPAPPSWAAPGVYHGKTPKERAQERAKARKKQKRKK